MSNYTPITNFTAKDALTTGDPNKKILGATIDAETSAISTAITSKFDTSGLTTTQTVSGAWTFSAANTFSNTNTFTVSQTLQNGAWYLYNTTPAADSRKWYISSDVSGTFNLGPSNDAQSSFGTSAIAATRTANTVTAITLTATNITLTGTVALGTALALTSGGTGATTASGARTNLGITATGADTTYNFRANNLSDVASAATSRTNLGVTATGADTTYAFRSNNLSDLGSASTSRTNLGATTLGANLFTLANPSAVTFLKVFSDNTVQTRTAAQMLSDLGVTATGADTTYAFRANNLSDLSNAGTARTNLGLGSLATLSTVNNGNWSGTALAIGNGGSGQTTQAAFTQQVTKGWTIQSDPGGTPTGSYGDVFAYY